LNNLPSRPQSSNAAFSLQRTYPFKECYEAPGEPFSGYCTSFGSLPGVRTFDDGKGWYPGLEYRPDLNATSPLYYRDADASTVIPSKGNQPYTTRIVDKDGKPVKDLYGEDIGVTILGSGNPADQKLDFGVEFHLLSGGLGNKWAYIWVKPAPAS
jgi:immune inhibitor A